jgi:hypothetical protein
MEIKSQMIKFRFIKSLLIISLLLSCLNATAPDIKGVLVLASHPIDSYKRIIDAVITVESLGDTLAFNPLEQAIGAFQIRPIRLQDYNNRTGNKYKLQDCYNLKISREIFLYYAKKIGYPNYEAIAREWNGSGKTTLDYWKRVKLNL